MFLPSGDSQSEELVGAVFTHGALLCEHRKTLCLFQILFLIFWLIPVSGMWLMTADSWSIEQYGLGFSRLGSVRSGIRVALVVFLSVG
jgi:hypothetical protein